MSSVVPAERRLMSDVTGGPQQARGVQRDYLGLQSVEWSILDATQAAMFDAWWKRSLTSGGAWFASAWPAPQGWFSVVRRFIGAPQWQHLAGGFWRVTAQLQVRGSGMPPLLYPRLLMGLHLDAYSTATTLSDAAGGTAVIGAGGALSTTSPKFGAACYRAPGAGVITGKSYGAFNLGATDWQIEGWVWLNNYTNVTLYSLHALVASGSNPGFGGDCLQIKIQIDGSTSPPGQLHVTYCIAGNTIYSLPTIAANNVLLNAWTHWAVVQDAAGVRGYIGGVKVGESVSNALYANALTPFTNQGAIIASAYAGGGWPGVYATSLDGGLDDLAVYVGGVTYTDASFTPPSLPFVKY